MQADVVQNRRIALAFDFDQNRDAAAVMVVAHITFAAFPLHGTADLHVFADDPDLVGQRALFGFLNRGADVAVARHIQHVGGELVDHVDEFIGLGRKVGLTENFDDRSLVSVDGGQDFALIRAAARLLLRLRGAGFAQVFNRQLHVAVGGGERLLAVHHAGSGLLPEVLNHFRGDLHYVILLSDSVWVTRPSLRSFRPASLPPSLLWPRPCAGRGGGACSPCRPFRRRRPSPEPASSRLRRRRAPRRPSSGGSPSRS